MSGANVWLVHFPAASDLTVTFAPRAPAAEVMDRYGDAEAVTMIDDWDGEPSCDDCDNRSRFGNCMQPVEAGIAESFGLVKHPDNGDSCVAYERRGRLV